VANKQNMIVMHHPDLEGREIKAINEAQAAVYAKSGWRRGPAKTEKKG